MDSVQFKSFFRSLDLSSLGHTIETVEEDTEGPADVFSGDVTIRNGKKRLCCRFRPICTDKSATRMQ